MKPMTDRFPPTYFARINDHDDEFFYEVARLVVHIDDQAIATLRTAFETILPPSGTYLDLMSSWRSHLPGSLQPERVIGLGMNADEMADNPQLTDYVLHNLNREPTLPFDNEQFEAAFCTVSVQYMTKPIEIFREVNRVLKPNAPFVISFSNRCFQQKAVAVWLSTSDEDHVTLVKQYFVDSGNWIAINTQLTPSQVQQGIVTDPMYILWAHKA